MPETSTFAIEPGKHLTLVSDVPCLLKITTEAGGVIEMNVSPHQDVKFTAPPRRMNFTVEVTIPEPGPRGPHLVEG